jgi:hypothetical protein
VGDDMGNLSKEHRADALQADAWLRDSETLATTRAVPSRAPAPAAPKEEVRACVCVCVMRLCLVTIHSPRPWPCSVSLTVRSP